MWVLGSSTHASVKSQQRQQLSGLKSLQHLPLPSCHVLSRTNRYVFTPKPPTHNQQPTNQHTVHCATNKTGSRKASQKVVLPQGWLDDTGASFDDAWMQQEGLQVEACEG